MARVTVEDCVVRVPNRFELVMKAAQRAREISAGSALTLERDNDKNPVVALREIADATVSLDELDESLVKNLQKFVEADEPEEDQMDFAIAGEAMTEGGAESESVAPGESSEQAAAASDSVVDEGAVQPAPENEPGQVRYEDVDVAD